MKKLFAGITIAILIIQLCLIIELRSFSSNYQYAVIEQTKILVEINQKLKILTLKGK